MNANWNFNENLPTGIKEASKEAFRPVWHSAVLNMGNEHNWRNLNDDGWFAGLDIGTVSANDKTWEVQLYEQGGIMQSVEGASRWAIRISGL